MASFPSYTSVGYANPLIIDNNFKTLTGSFNDNGVEKRRRMWVYPKRIITLSYINITRANAKTLWDFFLARYGSYQVFSFFLDYSDTYSGEYVNIGDGVTKIFSLPSKTGSSVKVYLDSVEQTLTTDYTLSAGTGGDGEDVLTFVTEPASGKKITYDFTGYLRIRCRFKEDKMSLEQMFDFLVSTGIELQGLLNSE